MPPLVCAQRGKSECLKLQHGIAKARQVAANSKKLGHSLETPKRCLEPVGPLDTAAAEPVPAAVVVGGIGAGDGALTAAKPTRAETSQRSAERKLKAMVALNLPH